MSWDEHFARAAEHTSDAQTENNVDELSRRIRHLATMDLLDYETRRQEEANALTEQSCANSAVLGKAPSFSTKSAQKVSVNLIHRGISVRVFNAVKVGFPPKSSHLRKMAR